LVSDGGAVTDIARDLLNRAQQHLWSHTEWQGLRKQSTLVVDPVTYLAPMPADYGRMVNIYWDSTGDGIADGYFDIGGTDPMRFADVRETFDISTGMTFNVFFGRVPTFTPIVRYIANLNDFTEVDAQNQPITEYSFFPAELLLKTAEMLHLQEKGSDNVTLGAVTGAHLNLLTQFEQMQNRGSSQDRAMRDALGYRVYSESLDLRGDDSSGGVRNGGYSNDTAWMGA